MRVLNVGSGGAGGVMPPIYEGWEIIRLDLDPDCDPDILLDARKLKKLDAGQFDAAFCSHFLEHVYPHDLRVVMHGFHHVLNDDGLLDVIVPNARMALQQMVDEGLDLDSFLYHTPGGPISVRDVLWGYSVQQALGHRPELMSHRNGFSQRTLGHVLVRSGFPASFVVGNQWDLRVIGFKRKPTDERLRALGVKND